MPKPILILGLLIIYGHIFSQKCHSVSFAYQFLHLAPHAQGPRVFHYVLEKDYKPDNEAQKRTEDYRYLHNGDDLKGAMDLFSGDVMGSDWLRNFDFGKFFTVTVEMNAGTYDHPAETYKWSSKLLFFKIFNQRKV